MQNPRQQNPNRPTPSPAVLKQRAAMMKRRKKALRRKRIRRFLLLLLLLLLFLFLMISVIRRIGRMVKIKNTQKTADVTETVSLPVTTEAEPEDTYVIPVYNAVHPLDAEPLSPYADEGTSAPGDRLLAADAILMDADTGHILAEKQSSPDGRIYPASMTKLMTLLVAYEQCSDLSDTFRMTQTIIDPLYLAGLSLAGFSGGEDVTVRDLLYGCALPSGAEACIGLAVYTSGSEEAFVSLMNDRAATLGMTGTHFVNCTGEHDDNHYTTLSDMALLLAFIEEDKTLSAILGTKEYLTAPTTQHPDGIVLSSTVYARMNGNESGVCTVTGGKTGNTVQAGQCLAVYAVHNTSGRRFCVILAGDNSKLSTVDDVTVLLSSYTY